MKPSEAPIKQPFVKRDFSPKKVLLILCPTCKKIILLIGKNGVSLHYQTNKKY